MFTRLLMPKIKFLDNSIDKVCRNDENRRTEVRFMLARFAAKPTVNRVLEMCSLYPVSRTHFPLISRTHSTLSLELTLPCLLLDVGLALSRA